MSRKGAFLILQHTHRPINQGPNKGKMQTTETCHFVDRYKREFVKNTYRQDGLTYDQVEEHVIKGYADKYKRFLEIVEAEIPEALLMSKEEVEAEIEKLTEEESSVEETE